LPVIPTVSGTHVAGQSDIAACESKSKYEELGLVGFGAM
jgi:hypothetical protein